LDALLVGCFCAVLLGANVSSPPPAHLRTGGRGINLFDPPPTSLFPVASLGAGSGATEFSKHHLLLRHLVMKHGGHEDLAELASLARIESETGVRTTFAIDLLPHRPPVATLPTCRERVGLPPPLGGSASGRPRPPPPGGPGNAPPCDGAGRGNRPAPPRACRATRCSAPQWTQRGGLSCQSELGCRPSHCRAQTAARDQPHPRPAKGGGGRGGRGSERTPQRT
jgi:hypothetical protein